MRLKSSLPKSYMRMNLLCMHRRDLAALRGGEQINDSINRFYLPRSGQDVMHLPDLLYRQHVAYDLASAIVQWLRALTAGTEFMISRLRTKKILSCFKVILVGSSN